MQSLLGDVLLNFSDTGTKAVARAHIIIPALNIAQHHSTAYRPISLRLNKAYVRTSNAT
jgi:hypothetical protein